MPLSPIMPNIAKKPERKGSHHELPVAPARQSAGATGNSRKVAPLAGASGYHGLTCQTTAIDGALRPPVAPSPQGAADAQ